MLRTLALSILLITGSLVSIAQSTLFDNSRVSSVFIEISPDSLNQIMTDVLSDHYFKARFIYEYATGCDTLEDIGFRLRGNTSRYSQKKSFKISFNEYSPGRKYQDVKKINLNGQHNDPTLVREKLFYDTWKKLGMPERRTSFVKLFINSQYYGLYTNLEELDKEWLQRVYGENDGNLYKCTYPADLVYLGTSPQTYKDINSFSVTGGRAYDLQTNESTDDYRDLVELIVTLSLNNDSMFISRISKELDVDEVLKAFALDVATGNWDDYMYDKNNYFLYHNLTSGKFEFISYDTDNTFGVDWMSQDWATRNCLNWFDHSEPRPLASRLLSIPAYKKKYEHYLDSIARFIIHPDSIFGHIDSIRNLISYAVYQDTYRTLDYGYTTYDFDNGFSQTIDGHTPYGIKPFLITRKLKILEQLPPNTLPESPKQTEDIFSFYPNPATDFIHIITAEKRSPVFFIISDPLGDKYFEMEINPIDKEILLNISKLHSGIYMLTMKSAGYSLSRKLIRK
jgi:spore coat protein CotH